MNSAATMQQHFLHFLAFCCVILLDIFYMVLIYRYYNCRLKQRSENIRFLVGLQRKKDKTLINTTIGVLFFYSPGTWLAQFCDKEARWSDISRSVVFDLAGLHLF